MKKIIYLIIGVCLLHFSSCGENYQFTEEELNFLPYKLGDSIMCWNNYSNDTLYLDVSEYIICIVHIMQMIMTITIIYIYMHILMVIQ